MKDFSKFLVYAILFLVLVTVLCIVFAVKMEERTASMVSGALSAFATIILGTIAIYQNRIYKKDSDKIYDISFMPEFYRATTFIEIMKYGQSAALQKLYIDPNFEGNSNGKLCGNYFSIRGPICNVLSKEFYVDDKLVTTEFIPRDNFSINSEQGSFQIICYLPDELMKNPHDYSIVIEYENMYGMKYSKKISFHIEELNGAINNLILEKAYRAK